MYDYIYIYDLCINVHIHLCCTHVIQKSKIAKSTIFAIPVGKEA